MIWSLVTRGVVYSSFSTLFHVPYQLGEVCVHSGISFFAVYRVWLGNFLGPRSSPGLAVFPENNMRLMKLSLLAVLPSLSAAVYNLVDNYQPYNFFDKFNFLTVSLD